MGEYCGVETACTFGDRRAEFSALGQGCAVHDRGWRAHFRIAGRDRVRWLNGMVTNNVRDLPVGQGNYSFLLSAQGHIQGDLYVYNRGEDFLATTEAAQFEKVVKVLQKYIIMDQVELTGLRDQLSALGIQGPQARKTMLGAGLSAGLKDELPKEMELREVNWRGRTLSVTRMPAAHHELYEVWVPPEEASSVWDSLIAAGAVPVGTEAVEMFRVIAGAPRYGVDIRERDLPQETAQMQALNFAKGCYIGQEIVERIRSRGNVHRTFTGFTVEGTTPLPGAKIHGAGKEIGEITTALPVPAGERDRVLALGYVRREAAKPGSALQVDGGAVIVTDLPFKDIL
jgi:folate-binding protein YgfZ